MKIEQADGFQPITLTLETRREAEILWAAIREYKGAGSQSEHNFCINISNWFSEHAQL